MNENASYLGLARILKHDESPVGVSPVGVGFLISSCHIVTCAHVVNVALGLSENSSVKPSERVTLDFPLTKSNNSIHASVQQWHPLKEHSRPGLTADIAVLEIKASEIHEGAQPVSFSTKAEVDLVNLEVLMVGFPEGNDSGLWSPGMIRGKTGEGWYQIDHDPRYHVVTKGFSGAPVWDNQDCSVVGMIVGIKHREGKTTAYLIPRSTISSACHGIDLHMTGKPAFGVIIPKMCNRDRQDSDFWDFFRKRYEHFPNQPQFYICYGEEGECHRSLSERLINHRIKSFFSNKWKKPIMSSDVKLSWNFEGNPETNREALVRKLIDTIEPGYRDMDYSLKALCRLPVLKRYQLFMIIHDIPVSEWNKNYSAFLEWYLKGYLGGPERSDDMPQFFIFLNIRYTGSSIIKRISRWDRFLLWRIKKALKRVQKSVGESCLLLDPLEPIESDSVRCWYLDFIIDNKKFKESEMEKEIRSIYKGKKKVCMAEIEKKIEEVHKHYRQDKSGFYE